MNLDLAVRLAILTAMEQDEARRHMARECHGCPYCGADVTEFDEPCPPCRRAIESDYLQRLESDR